MNIKNNLIEGVEFIPSPNIGGSIEPTLVVLHYTASGGAPKSDANYFSKAAAKASAHVIVGRDGTIIQCVPFKTKAWHAGKSIWGTKSNCNDFSIGIEIQNWGLLSKRADDKFYSHTGTEVPANLVIQKKNKLGNNGFWEVYPDEQLKAVELLCKALIEEYPNIKAIVGHEDISPRRKIYPGPALYSFMSKLNENMFNPRNSEITDKEKEVIATSLNIRSKPSTSATIVGKLSKNDKVSVVYEASGWSQLSSGGWVFSKYLK